MATRKANPQGSEVVAARSGRLGPGQAPPVGVENAAKARENIKAKLVVIESWIKSIHESGDIGTLVPFVSFDELPRSQREFNAWGSELLSKEAAGLYGAFHKNGNATLLRNPDLLELLLGYIDILKRHKTSNSSQKKADSFAKLQRRLSMERSLRDIAEKELVRARALIWSHQKTEERLRSELISTEKKSKEMIEELEVRLAQESSERSELTRTLKKISGLKSVDR